jgi:hypothetical protein
MLTHTHRPYSSHVKLRHGGNATAYLQRHATQLKTYGATYTFDDLYRGCPLLAPGYSMLSYDGK